MKIVFLLNSEYSHIVGIRDFLIKLNKVHDVHVFVGSRMKSLVNIENLKVYIYPDIIFNKNHELFFRDYLKYRRLDRDQLSTFGIEKWSEIHYEMLEYNLRASETFVNHIISTIKIIKPDLLIRDTVSIYGRKIGDILNIPILAYATSMIMPNSVFFDNPRQAIEDSYGYDLSSFSDEDVEKIKINLQTNTHLLCQKFDYRILPINHLVDPGEKNNFCYGSQFYHSKTKNTYFYLRNSMCTSTQGNPKKENSKTDQNVYVSSGTVITFPSDFYKKLVKSLNSQEKKYPIDISFKLADTGFVKIKHKPNNVTIQSFFNQSEKLKKAKVHISHGGYNSVMESISNLVPMLIVPLQNDQYMNGMFVKKNGLGECISMSKFLEMDDFEIFTVVKNLIEKSTYKKNLLEMLQKQRGIISDDNTIIKLIEGL